MIPPPSERGPGRASKWDALAGELREQPGRWAVIGEYETTGKATSPAKQLRARGCEVVSRRQPDETLAVWARWPEGDGE
jgi:hypothetical protein